MLNSPLFFPAALSLSQPMLPIGRATCTAARVPSLLLNTLYQSERLAIKIQHASRR
jgi:hypothetical protein